CFVPHPKNQPIVGFANRAEKNRRVNVAATWGAASGAPAASSCVGRRRVISQNANQEIGVPKGLGVEGEGEGKFGALAYCTFYPEFAAMSFDDVFGDAEAEAGAARSAEAGTQMWPRGGVYWMALSRRFCSTSRSRAASPRTAGSCGGTVISRVISLRLALSSVVSVQASMSSSRPTEENSSSIFPASMRASLRRSLVRRARRMA